MKDIQGVDRGKCNTCDECQEYVAPKSGARCDYCNHTPVDHVRLIRLGACKRCHQGDCEEYMSEDKNSYTDCQYCGCPAAHHEGAEKLRRKPDKKAVTSVTSPPTVSAVGGLASVAGACKMPGCGKPRCRESNGRVHEFCSRTCANTYNKVGQGSQPPSIPTQSFTTGSQPPSIVTGHSSLFSTAPAKKVCSKCGKNPANAGYPHCESCYAATKGDSS